MVRWPIQQLTKQRDRQPSQSAAALALHIEELRQPCWVCGKLPRGAKMFHAVVAIRAGAPRLHRAHRQHGVDRPPPERVRARPCWMPMEPISISSPSCLSRTQ